MELLSENLSPLFSKKYYKTTEISDSYLEKEDRKNKLFEIGLQSKVDYGSIINKKLNNYNFEKIDRGLLQTTIGDINKSNNKKKVWSHYKKIPGNPFTIDISTDSQVKESFSDNQFEYGSDDVEIELICCHAIE